MPRFQAIHYLVHSAVAFLCYLALTQLEAVDRFIAETPTIRQYPFLTLSVIPLIAVLLQQSDRLARLIIGGIPLVSPLLRRTLQGSDFIEGQWPLVVVDGKSGQLVFYGFLTISFKDSQLYVCGNDWKPDGTHALWFHSVQSRFRERLLQYWYEQGPNRTKPEMRGYTEMYFFPEEGRVKRQAGEFLDKTHNLRFYAERRTFSRLSGRPPKTDAERIAAAKDLWQRLQPDLPRLLQQTVSKDWV
ncbi:MAG: hypothetical protein KJ622_14720 [Alphaproteobacteria bacterium]|nr:hypothetical protein [Alphaproteobacteria bacterium]